MLNEDIRNIDGVLPSEIYFDPALKRYRYRGGGEGKPIRGTFVSRADALSLQKEYLKKASEEFIKLAPRIMKGEFGIYKEAAHLLKSIHLSTAVIAAGGFDKLTEKDLGSIGSILKKQYYSGKGENGKLYGLKHLLKQVQEGKISVSQPKYRLSLYVKSSDISGNVVKQNDAYRKGMSAMKRIDAKDDAECESCINYASVGWTIIGGLPLPKTECLCRTNCRCKVIYAKLEDVVLGS